MPISAALAVPGLASAGYPEKPITMLIGFLALAACSVYRMAWRNPAGIAKA